MGILRATLLLLGLTVGAAAYDLDSVADAELNRARIVAAVNGDPASPWRAATTPVARFAGKSYRVLATMAGVLGGDPAENKAGLQVKTLAQIEARRATAGQALSVMPANFSAKSNWPNCPIIGEIRDQSACGSCYAVSAASVATDRFCIANNGTKVDRLSATDLMSCCKTCAGSNGGCFGGTPSHCWDYMNTQGIASGGAYGDYSKCLAYPFPLCSHHINGTYPTCPEKTFLAPTCWWSCDRNTSSKITYDQSQAAHKFGTSYKVDANMAAIQSDIFQHGPAQASMFLTAEFEVYKSGVFTTQSKKYIGAHAIKIVGWGTDAASGLDYWTIQNSWNVEWGEKGYFRIERGKNILSIESGVVAGTIAKW